METVDKVTKKLQDLEKRVAHLESLVPNRRSHVAVSDPKSLLDHILSLRDKRFFSEARTAQEAHERVQQVYRCEQNRVAVELLRLAEKKLLRKTKQIVGGKEYKAYVW